MNDDELATATDEPTIVRSPRPRYLSHAEAAILLDMTEEALFFWRVRGGPQRVLRPEGWVYIADQIEFLAALPAVRRYFAVKGSHLRRYWRKPQEA